MFRLNFIFYFVLLKLFKINNKIYIFKTRVICSCQLYGFFPYLTLILGMWHTCMHRRSSKVWNFLNWITQKQNYFIFSPNTTKTLWKRYLMFKFEPSLFKNLKLPSAMCNISRDIWTYLMPWADTITSVEKHKEFHH